MRIRLSDIFLVTAIITLFLWSGGCRHFRAEIWDRKRSDVCEDWEEKAGECRNGKGVLFHYRVDMR